MKCVANYFKFANGRPSYPITHVCSYIFIYALRGQRSPIYVKCLCAKYKHTKQNKQINTYCGLFDQQRQWERQRRRAYTAKFAVQTLFCPLLRLHCLFLEFVLVAVHERERIGVQIARERVVDRERERRWESDSWLWLQQCATALISATSINTYRIWLLSITHDKLVCYSADRAFKVCLLSLSPQYGQTFRSHTHT